MGDSVIVDEYNPFVNKYSVAIYGENSDILNDTNGSVSVGENSAGLYAVGGSIVNKGTVTSVKNGAIGIFIDNGTAENTGLIDLYGADSVGLGTEFWSCFAVYLIIQALDGNLLVPVLFSEAVNLHPLVIILSVVIFGGLWGFWGVFFAIPLATLIKAVVHAWPDGLIVEDEH